MPCSRSSLLIALSPLFLLQSPRAREVHQVSIWAAPLLPSSSASPSVSGSSQRPALPPSPAFWEAVHPHRPGPSRSFLIPPAPLGWLPSDPVLVPLARTLGMTVPTCLFQGTEVRDSEVRRGPTTRGEASFFLLARPSGLQQALSVALSGPPCHPRAFRAMDKGSLPCA